MVTLVDAARGDAASIPIYDLLAIRLPDGLAEFRLAQIIPDQLNRHGDFSCNLDHNLVGGNCHALSAAFTFPYGLHILHPNLHFAEMLDCLDMGCHVPDHGLEAQPLERSLGVEAVSREAHFF